MPKPKLIESPEKMIEILNPELEFELPYKKNLDGYYNITPNTKFIGGKNCLRDVAKNKVKEGYVYLINIEGTKKYKIGVSKNPKRRISDISNYIPFELNILAINKIKNPYHIEEELLTKFNSKLIKNEWFNLEIEDAKYIIIYLHNKQVLENINEA
jgi:hypothetical protein